MKRPHWNCGKRAEFRKPQWHATILTLLASLQHLQLFLNSFPNLSFLSWPDLVIPRVDCGIGTPSWADMTRCRALVDKWVMSWCPITCVMSWCHTSQWDPMGIVGHFQLGGLSPAFPRQGVTKDWCLQTWSVRLQNWDSVRGCVNLSILVDTFECWGTFNLCH